MATERDDLPLTFKMIDLYLKGSDALLPMIKEAAGTADLVAAVTEGRIKRRGKIQQHFHCRVRADHLVIAFNKFRVEFDYRYPKAFGANLMHRHIELNPRLMRLFPEYLDLSLVRDLDELRLQGLIELVDARDQLFELTTEGVLARRLLRN